MLQAAACFFAGMMLVLGASWAGRRSPALRGFASRYAVAIGWSLLASILGFVVLTVLSVQEERTALRAAATLAGLASGLVIAHDESR